MRVEYIKKYFTGAKVYTAYEAGFSGFYLHRYLEANGIENIVVHPASIQVSSRDRVKTDKRDSLKIAKQLSTRELHGIIVPSEERENFRTVTRTRDAIVETKKRVGNQLKSLLFLHGLIKPEEDMKVCRTWIKKIQGLDVGEDIKYCINMYTQIWLDLDTKVQEILRKLTEQAKEDEKLDVIYRAAPGIGALSARVLSNELMDMQYFRNEKNLFSYTGLTPGEYFSGEHRWQGRISRQGKSILRKILVQVAWRAIKTDAHLAAVFERISKKAGKKKAIIGIARRIIGCIRSCFINGEIWRTNAPVGQESLIIKAETC
jgi:transposase